MRFAWLIGVDNAVVVRYLTRHAIHTECSDHIWSGRLVRILADINRKSINVKPIIHFRQAVKARRNQIAGGLLGLRCGVNRSRLR
jgi:hypothetical protein